MSIVALLEKEKRPVIELGAKNKPIIFEIQKVLTDKGYYNFKPDGKYGKKTDAAVRAFQNDNKISVDGDVGPVTAAFLDKASGASNVISFPVPERTEKLLATSFPYQREYQTLWDTIRVDPKRLKEIAKVIDKLRDPARWAEYQKLEKATGVPSLVTAIIHERESGANLKGVLHNGEKIIGTGRKTKLVPAGRGPFNSFFDAGVDAFHKEGLDSFDWEAGGMARLAYALEKFNGFGYRKWGIHSPYLWAATSHYSSGKYISDGKFSIPTYIDGGKRWADYRDVAAYIDHCRAQAMRQAA